MLDNEKKDSILSIEEKMILATKWERVSDSIDSISSTIKTASGYRDIMTEVNKEF
jgi:hypothetical protein